MMVMVKKKRKNQLRKYKVEKKPRSAHNPFMKRKSGVTN